MNEEKIIEAMARADGKKWTLKTDLAPLGKRVAKCLLPDYLTDDNQIDRMVRGLDEKELSAYVGYLERVMGCGLNKYLFQATAEQKVEAYLRAVGKWTKEME